MRLDFFEHFMRLIAALTILSSDSISDVLMETAKDLLRKFVREFELLYGLQFCTINVHQLLHLSDCVRELGPLWAHTCYEYEDLNGKILSLIHGTTHIDTQVANSQNQYIKMVRLVEALPDGDLREFCLQKKKQIKIIEQVHEHAYSVRVYKHILVIPDLISNAMLNSGFIINNVLIYQYFRLLKSNKLYASEFYTRVLQTHSFCVQYSHNNQCRLGSVVCFVKVCTCIQATCNCVSQHYAIIRQITSDAVFIIKGDQFTYNSSEFLNKCRYSENTVAIPIENLISTCIYICINNQSYIALPINKRELE